MVCIMTILLIELNDKYDKLYAENTELKNEEKRLLELGKNYLFGNVQAGSNIQSSARDLNILLGGKRDANGVQEGSMTFLDKMDANNIVRRMLTQDSDNM